jgi:hypothetical protein
MRRLVFLAWLALACAGASARAAPGACPPGVEEVLASPALLREQADVALKEDNSELAYRYLALIEELHPESAQSRELFPAAARLFQRNYFRNRVGKPDSVWTTAEPAFMFHWLSEFFRDAKQFPQQQVDQLFIGMPVTLHDEFLVYAKGRPKYFARWETRVSDDDGHITSVIASPAPGR